MKLFGTILFCLILVGCGGNSSKTKEVEASSSFSSETRLSSFSSSNSSTLPVSKSLQVTASDYVALAGGEPISLHAFSKKNSDSIVNWRLQDSSKGNLSTTFGDFVEYIPPNADDLPNDGFAVIIASENDSALTITIRIKQNSFFVFSGGHGAKGSSTYVDGNGIEAGFGSIRAFTIDRADNIYVSDSRSISEGYSVDADGSQAIRRITPNGEVSTFYDLTKSSAQQINLFSVGALAIDDAGNLYGAISDNSQQKYCQIVNFHIGEVLPYAGNSRCGSSIGIGVNAQFSDIKGLLVDHQGNLLVTDSSSVRKVDDTGLVTVLAGQTGSSGYYDSQGGSARFDVLSGMAKDDLGNIYVYDRGLIRKLDPQLNVSTFYNGNIGSRWLSGALAVNSSGYVFAALGRDPETSLIQFSPSSIRTDLETPQTSPSGLAFDSKGNLYFANGNILQKMTPNGVISVFAGGARAFTGVPLNYNFLSSDNRGNLYLIKTGYYPYQMGNLGFHYGYTISMIDNDEVFTTLSPKLIPEIEANNVSGFVVDNFGNLFVVQNRGYDDYSVGTITKIYPDGSSQLIAGLDHRLYDSNDGVGSEAHFQNPTGITIDQEGNLYVLELVSSLRGKAQIRKVTQAGVVTTLAKDLDACVADSSQATPLPLLINKTNEFYFIDGSCSAIKKVDIYGTVTTLAGGDLKGYLDGQGVTAMFDGIVNGVIDDDGNLYVLEKNNLTIRKITPEGLVTTLAGVPGMPGVRLGSLPGKLSRIGNINPMAMLGENTLIFGDGQIIFAIRVHK